MSGNRHDSKWTDELVDELTRLYATGISCADIGAQLGFSRNAIIGKSRRIDLPPPANRKVAKPRERKVLTVEPAGHGHYRVRESRAKVEPTKLRCVEVAPRNIPLSELADNDCRFIPGDDHLYCANPQFPGSSYCGPHHAIMWIKPIKTWARAA